MIDFLVIGKGQSGGMNREEIAAFIKEELLAKNLIKEPRCDGRIHEPLHFGFG